MSTIETTIDPQAVKYLQNAEYFFVDPYFSARMPYIYRLLERLENLHLAEHIPTKAVAFICGLSAQDHKRFAFITHEPSDKLPEKYAILSSRQTEIAEQLGVTQPEIHLLKTVTLQVKYRKKPYYFLVSGLGDFYIDGEMKAAMEPAVQRALGVKGKVMGRTSINPPEEEFPPIIHLGLKPGIISPFADLTRFGGDQKLSGLLYYRDPSINIKKYAAVAMSETDTLIIDCSILTPAINLWQGFYSNIRYEAVGNEDLHQHNTLAEI